MTDGGGANKAKDMPVHGNHYVADSDLTRYPALAYEANDAGGGRGRWTWDEKRPRYIGEDFSTPAIIPNFRRSAAKRRSGARCRRYRPAA